MIAKSLKVLVVVDMQNDFITGSLGTKEAQAIVPNVVKKIEAGDYDILAMTQDTHYSDYLETQEGKNLPIKHCLYATEGHKLHPDIERAISSKEEEGVPTLCENKIAFGDIELPEELKGVVDDVFYDKIDNPIEQIKTIEIVGLCTDICVISNAMILKAAFPEVEIVVDSSCCAGTSSESHQRALEAMKVCQIKVI